MKNGGNAKFELIIGKRFNVYPMWGKTRPSIEKVEYKNFVNQKI